MNLVWGLSTLPFILVGFTDQYWLLLASMFVIGFGFSYGNVIWGTLLQRRVPRHMLGRVSSLDFFVSLALMPISMAVAGPVGEWIGLAPAFLIAGVVPPLLALATLAFARLGRDELAHPLDGHPDEDVVTGAEAAAGFAPPVDEPHHRHEPTRRPDPDLEPG
jgi:MFS family permease